MKTNFIQHLKNKISQSSIDTKIAHGLSVAKNTLSAPVRKIAEYIESQNKEQEFKNYCRKMQNTYLENFETIQTNEIKQYTENGNSVTAINTELGPVIRTIYDTSLDPSIISKISYEGIIETKNKKCLYAYISKTIYQNSENADNSSHVLYEGFQFLPEGEFGRISNIGIDQNSINTHNSHFVYSFLSNNFDKSLAEIKEVTENEL